MEGSSNNMNTLSSSSTAVTVVGSDAPSEYHVAPRTENPPQNLVTESLKKKRGRPRKYAPDGSVAHVGVVSPKPISSSAPPPPPSSVIDFSAGVAVEKRGKVRSVAYGAKLHQQQARVETESLSNGINSNDDWVSSSIGASFIPHIISVNAGEDVMMKIISFSQQGPRAICILSANGVISSVTLRQPDSSGGTLTYEGLFEILSLTGSFMPSESGGMRNRSGGMSVSLAGPDGRVVGGGVAGLLVAAGPMQIVVGSFLGSNQHDQKIKKYKPEPMPTISRPTAAIPISSSTPTSDDMHPISSTFQGDSWSAIPQNSRNNPTDINVTLPG